MAIGPNIENLRERLRSAAKGRGLILFGGVLAVVIVGLAAGGIALLKPKPPPTQGLDGPAFCRPCAALSRLERSMKEALAKNEDVSASLTDSDRKRVLSEISNWQRRCSTLLCSAPQKNGQALACAAPPASLLTELASIDDLASTLTRRTSICAAGGCQTTRCEQANRTASAFLSLEQELRTLIDNPSTLVGGRRQVSTSFVFDQLGALSDTVLAAPAYAADGRFASAEARLLYLRDEAVDAESQSPDSAEGLLADRLEEVSTAIEALAQAKRIGVSGAGLVSLWRDFAETSARLLVETATLQAEMHAQSDSLQAMFNPEVGATPAGADKVCEGTLRLVQSTEHRLSQAVGQLDTCNERAACGPAANEGTTSQIPPGKAPNARVMLELLASQREAAAAALRPLGFEKDPDVMLTTDLQQYFGGEAIAVRALAETNRCLSDRGSHLKLTMTGSGTGGTSEVVQSHALDPADAAAWLFDAPQTGGAYQFVLETSKSRGEGKFGASPVFAVTPTAAAGCSGFTGRWQTDFGVFTVIVRDGIARGSYRRERQARAGVFVGTVEGSTMTGRWTSELGDGGARLALDPGGRSFQGTWSQYPGRTSGAGRWNGKCLGATAAPDSSGQG